MPGIETLGGTGRGKGGKAYPRRRFRRDDIAVKHTATGDTENMLADKYIN